MKVNQTSRKDMLHMKYQEIQVESHEVKDE